MKVLYAGDSEAGGPANYLLGILRFMKARFVHIPPGQKIKPSLFKKRFDAVILSDFSHKDMSSGAEQSLIEQVNSGTGFLMVGGWGSFAGPSGNWQGSKLSGIFPVHCLKHDDRMNFPSGAWVTPKRRHPILQALSFSNPPVICGVNQIRAKSGCQTLLVAKRLIDGRDFPLLIISSDEKKRTAALATDLAPHWCGGLVDWGKRRLNLSVTGKIRIEVSDLYVKFVSSLVRWTARKD